MNDCRILAENLFMRNVCIQRWYRKASLVNRNKLVVAFSNVGMYRRSSSFVFSYVITGNENGIAVYSRETISQSSSMDGKYGA